jgi:hypothetical protein
MSLLLQWLQGKQLSEEFFSLQIPILDHKGIARKIYTDLQHKTGATGVRN